MKTSSLAPGTRPRQHGAQPARARAGHQKHPWNRSHPHRTHPGPEQGQCNASGQEEVEPDPVAPEVARVFRPGADRPFAQHRDDRERCEDDREARRQQPGVGARACTWACRERNELLGATGLAAVDRLMSLRGDPSRAWRAVDPAGGYNAMRLVLQADGLKPLVVDWPAMAGETVSFFAMICAFGTALYLTGRTHPAATRWGMRRSRGMTARGFARMRCQLSALTSIRTCAGVTAGDAPCGCGPRAPWPRAGGAFGPAASSRCSARRG